MMVAGKRMADQYGIAGIGIERAIGFINQRKCRQHSATLQRQWVTALKSLWPNQADGAGKNIVHEDNR